MECLLLVSARSFPPNGSKALRPMYRITILNTAHTLSVNHFLSRFLSFQFLMSSLAESNRMLTSVQSKYNELNELNGSFQMHIDELKTENEQIIEKIKMKNILLEELETKMKEQEKRRLKMVRANIFPLPLQFTRSILC